MKRAFKVKKHIFFIIFKELSVTKNCLFLRPENVPLKNNVRKHSQLFIATQSRSADLENVFSQKNIGIPLGYMYLRRI